MEGGFGIKNIYVSGGGRRFAEPLDLDLFRQ